MILNLVGVIIIMGIGLIFDYKGDDNNINLIIFLYKMILALFVTGGILFAYRKQIKQFYVIFIKERKKG